MLDNEVPQRSPECWQLDLEIEQTLRFFNLWQAHAQLHRETGLAEAIETIASGYARQLEELRRTREGLFGALCMPLAPPVLATAELSTSL